MTRYTAVPSKTFEQELDKLSLAEQKTVLRKVVLLENNPYYASLYSKKLRGKRDLFESRVNMDLRILWYYKNSKTIQLVDVGHHDILKKY